MLCMLVRAIQRHAGRAAIQRSISAITSMIPNAATRTPSTLNEVRSRVSATATVSKDALLIWSVALRRYGCNVSERA
jgi:hypothetical protein